MAMMHRASASEMSTTGRTRTAEPTTTTTQRAGRRRAAAALWGSLSLFVVNTVALLIYHVHTSSAAVAVENGNPGNDDDVSQHQEAAAEFPVISAMDKILFGVLVLMAFELLDFITKNSGSMWNCARDCVSCCFVFQN